MMVNLVNELKRSLTLLEIEYVVISDKNIIRMLGENYGLIQIAENDAGFRIVKIIEKSEIDRAVLNNLDCINFDLEQGEYYIRDNELWFEITIINDDFLTFSDINDSIVNFCNAPSLLNAN